MNLPFGRNAYYHNDIDEDLLAHDDYEILELDLLNESKNIRCVYLFLYLIEEGITTILKLISLYLVTSIL